MPAPLAPPSLPDRYRLGEWTVDARAGELTRDGATLHLEPKVMGVLHHLAAQAGQVVARDDLMDAVWPDVVVTENALSRCVSDLRRALGEDPRAPALIETIPKMGYRLLVPVEPAAAPGWPPLHTGDSVPAVADLSGPAPALPTPRRRRLALRLGAGGLLLLAAAGALLLARPEEDVLTAGPLRPVTAQAGSEGLATLAPGGDRVAYVRFREGRLTGHIEIVGTDGGTPLALTAGPEDTHPAFSPDGQHIAFLRCQGERCRPYRVSALGTDERPLADVGAHASGLAWSPDGRRLALVVQPEGAGPRHLALLDLRTGRTRRLTAPPATALGDIFPTFSPDGATLAFVRRMDAVAGDLFTVPVRGGEPRAVTRDHSQVARHTWLPDGRALLAASDRDGTFRLWRFPIGGAAPTPLPVEAEMPVGPALAAAGDRLVFEAWDLPIQLWVHDPSGARERRRLAPSTRWDQMPDLSPDGRRAAFVSTRSGHAEVWVADLDGVPPRPLTRLSGPAVRSPKWSPDGRWIAFVARVDGQFDLHLVSAEGGPPRRLTATAADEAHPRWAADSRSLFVGRRRADRWEGIRIGLDGAEAPVPLPGARVLAPSPDGRTLWFSRADTTGLWSLALGVDGKAAARPVLRVPDLAADAPAAWALTRDGIVYLRRRGEDPDLVRWAEGHTEVLLPRPLGLDRWAPPFAVTADGAALVLAQMGLPQIDVLTTTLTRH